MPTRFPPRQPWEIYRLPAYLVLYLEEGSIAKTLVKTLLNGVNYKLSCAEILMFSHLILAADNVLPKVTKFHFPNFHIALLNSIFRTDLIPAPSKGFIEGSFEIHNMWSNRYFTSNNHCVPLPHEKIWRSFGCPLTSSRKKEFGKYQLAL